MGLLWSIARTRVPIPSPDERQPLLHSAEHFANVRVQLRLRRRRDLLMHVDALGLHAGRLLIRICKRRRAVQADDPEGGEAAW